MNEADAGCLSLSSNSSRQSEDEDEDDGGLGVDYRDDADALAAMSEESGSWVDWFLGLRAHSFFCEVEDDYLGDDFNLTGLAHAVSYRQTDRQPTLVTIYLPIFLPTCCTYLSYLGTHSYHLLVLRCLTTTTRWTSSWTWTSS
jgi:hypothetical protein